MWGVRADAGTIVTQKKLGAEKPRLMTSGSGLRQAKKDRPGVSALRNGWISGNPSENGTRTSQDCNPGAKQFLGGAGQMNIQNQEVQLDEPTLTHSEVGTLEVVESRINSGRIREHMPPAAGLLRAFDSQKPCKAIHYKQ
jgi:hypothetical protein